MPGRWVGMKVDLDLDLRLVGWLEEEGVELVDEVEREREEAEVCDARCMLDGDEGFGLDDFEGIRMVLWWKEPLIVSVS